MTTGIPEQWKASLGKDSFQGNFLTECQFLSLLQSTIILRMQFNDFWVLYSNQELGELSGFQGKLSTVSENRSYRIHPFISQAKLNDSNQEAAGTITGVTAFILPQPEVEMSVLLSWKHQTREEMHLFYGLSEVQLEELQRSVPELSYDRHKKNSYQLRLLSVSNEDTDPQNSILRQRVINNQLQQ